MRPGCSPFRRICPCRVGLGAAGCSMIVGHWWRYPPPVTSSLPGYPRWAWREKNGEHRPRNPISAKHQRRYIATETTIKSQALVRKPGIPDILATGGLSALRLVRRLTMIERISVPGVASELGLLEHVRDLLEPGPSSGSRTDAVKICGEGRDRRQRKDATRRPPPRAGRQRTRGPAWTGPDWNAGTRTGTRRAAPPTTCPTRRRD
jgi:hypothetical protein